MSLELILTDDGSSSLLVPELNETYHSIRGAISESEHVFINAGLKFWLSKNPAPLVNILEIGLGTGLNALLTALSTGNATVNYIGVENNILTKQVWEKLNYPELFDKRNSSDIFSRIHNSTWEEKIEITENFWLTKIESRVQDLQIKSKFDIIYFDAFAPNKQPEIWNIKVLEKMAELSVPGGLFVTYCANGLVKRGLRSVGFKVKRLEGPPGKFHMIRATREV